MALSRLAREFAAEIRGHDWSDAPYRLDRAGHQREGDTHRSKEQLTVEEGNRVRANVALVVAQVLGYGDPNLEVEEFVAACRVELSPGEIHYGLRFEEEGNLAAPGGVV